MNEVEEEEENVVYTRNENESICGFISASL